MLILNTVELCWLELEGTIKKFRNFREKEFWSWPWSVSYAMNDKLYSGPCRKKYLII